MRDIMLFTHMLGLAMGLGTSFAFMFLGIAAKKMENSESLKFKIDTLAITRMGHIGITLLLISGFYLITPYWSSLSTMLTLMIKLVLVLVLLILISAITVLGRKAKEGDPEANFKKIEALGKVSMLTAIAIVGLAVYTFH